MKQILFTKANNLTVAVLVAMFEMLTTTKVVAQTQENDNKGKVHMTIVKTVNGKTTVVDTTYDAGANVKPEDLVPDADSKDGKHKVISEKIIINDDDSSGKPGTEFALGNIHIPEMNFNLDSLMNSTAMNIKTLKLDTLFNVEKGKEFVDSVIKSIDMNMFIIDNSRKTIDSAEKAVNGNIRIMIDKQKVIIDSIQKSDLMKQSAKKSFIITAPDSKNPGSASISSNTKVIIYNVQITDPSKQEKKELKANGGVSQISSNNLSADKLNFYPNPTNGQFRVTFSLPDRGNTTLKIFDATGKTIYNENIGDFQGDYDKSLDISGYGKGAYFLQIIQGNKALVKKIIVE